MSLNVSVLDVNDNSPRFIEPAYSVDVTDDTLPGSSLVRLSATDDDTGENGHVTFRIVAAERDDVTAAVSK